MSSKSKSKSNKTKKEESAKSISLNSSIFKNSNELVENLTKIKNGLTIENDKTAKFKSTFNELEKEDVQISEIYKNETNVIKELNDNTDYSLNIKDNIFKNRVKKILSDVYDLKENLLYPHFQVEYSSKNKSNIVKIYYYRISLRFDENKKILDDKKIKTENKIEEIKTDKKEDNNESESFVFLDDRKIYMAYFKEMPIIFQKNKEGFTYATVISEDFQSFGEFEIKKINEKVFETSIPY